MADHNEIIDNMIRTFNVNCEAKGHYFADNPIRPGWQYCKACGDARPIEQKETDQ